MYNIPYEILLKLKKVHFSFPEYEHLLNYGMVYYYQGNEYTIGGTGVSEFTEKDKAAAKDGIWLPSTSALFDWLRLTNFEVSLSYSHDRGCYCIRALDRENGAHYQADGAVLAYTLATLIYKICKSNLRNYVPSHEMRLQVDCEN